MPEESQSAPLVHKIYRYRIASFKLIVPDFDGPIDMVPGSINMAHLECDYDNNIYPIFSITCVTNPKLKEYISMRRTEVKFHINLKCETYDTHSSDVMPESSEDVFNAMFIPMITDDVPFVDAAIYNQTTEQLRTIARNGGSVDDLGGHNMMGDHRTNVTYYFYVEKDLNNSKNVVNQIFANTNIPTIVAKLMADNGFDKILMSPVDNAEPISQCIIQPQNLLNLFSYLSDYYGMHATGTITFFDYRCVYILNKSGHPNALEEEEYPVTIFSIQETKYSESNLAGTLTCAEKKEYHIYPDPHRVTVSNPSAVNDHISGNNVTMINSQLNGKAHVEGAGNQRGTGNTRVGNNTNANSYNTTQYANQIQEGNVNCKMTLFDPYMWALTPNKENIIHWVGSSVDESFSGYYRITKADYVFSRNGEKLNLTANLNMVKKEDISAAMAQAIDQEVNPSMSFKNATAAAVGGSQISTGNITSGLKIPGGLKLPGIG